jgi:hypothetical protein
MLRVAELKMENNHLPMETHIFEVAGAIRRAVLPPGGTDTCTLRGEDRQYCGALHSISAIVLLDD